MGEVDVEVRVAGYGEGLDHAGVAADIGEDVVVVEHQLAFDRHVEFACPDRLCATVDFGKVQPHLVSAWRDAEVPLHRVAVGAVPALGLEQNFGRADRNGTVARVDRDRGRGRGTLGSRRVGIGVGGIGSGSGDRPGELHRVQIGVVHDKSHIDRLTAELAHIAAAVPCHRMCDVVASNHVAVGEREAWNDIARTVQHFDANASAGTGRQVEFQRTAAEDHVLGDGLAGRARGIDRREAIEPHDITQAGLAVQ